MKKKNKKKNNDHTRSLHLPMLVIHFNKNTSIKVRRKKKKERRKKRTTPTFPRLLYVTRQI